MESRLSASGGHGQNPGRRVWGTEWNNCYRLDTGKAQDVEFPYAFGNFFHIIDDHRSFQTHLFHQPADFLDRNFVQGRFDFVSERCVVSEAKLLTHEIENAEPIQAQEVEQAPQTCVDLLVNSIPTYVDKLGGY